MIVLSRKHPETIGRTVAGDRFLVEGGHRLEGRVRVSGNKNAAIHTMAATLLTSDDCYLENVPAIGDVRFMVEILRALGATVEYTSPSSLRVNAAGVDTLGGAQRAGDAPSRQLPGHGTAARPASARPPAARPAATSSACARSTFTSPASASSTPRSATKATSSSPARNGFAAAGSSSTIPSVLGTQNLMLAATLAEGRTTLVNAAAEPEIESLVEMLTQMGARISGAGRHTIEIEGVGELHGARHRIIPDRIEAGTFAIAAAATQGDVEIEEGVPQQLDALIWKLRRGGVERRGDGRRCSTSVAPARCGR